MTKKMPSGFQTVTPYVIVKDASAAIALYKKAFSAVESSVLRGPDGKIGHACLTIGTSKFFLADENPAMKSKAPGADGASVSFYLYLDDADAAQKKALSAGMKELMPVTDMFWGDRMGAVVDSFGYKWNVATQVKEMTEDEVKKAAEKFFSKAA